MCHIYILFVMVRDYVIAFLHAIRLGLFYNS